MKNEEHEKNVLKRVFKKMKNSKKINYEKVVKKMNNSEEQYKIITENMDKIIEQNEVRDTLKHIEDEKVVKIVKEQKNKLKDNQKIAYAILAVGDNEKKMKELLKNCEYLSDIEIAEILNSFKPEKSLQKQKERDNQKINLIAFRIIENLVKYGNTWHLNELTSCFYDDSKTTILNMCLSLLHYRGKNKNISSESKVKLVCGLFETMDNNFYDKNALIDQYVKSEFLNNKEAEMIENKLKNEKIQEL